MRKILVLFAHPRFEHSIVNRELTGVLTRHPAITFHDLYQQYPDFDVDVPFEQELVQQHDLLIWHHPVYWYSCPPLLKQWIDLVLAFNWAYGPKGNALEGKAVFNLVTSGGTKEAYQTGARNRFSLKEFFAPFDQTAVLCQMKYLAPFAIQGTHRLTPGDFRKELVKLQQILDFMAVKDHDLSLFEGKDLMNDVMLPQTVSNHGN